MENVLTFAACSQLLLSIWVMDWMATAPGIILGVIVFALLVRAVRQVLEERKREAQPASKVRKAPRVLYR